MNAFASPLTQPSSASLFPLLLFLISKTFLHPALHLFGPIRPTRGHIAISPHGGYRYRFWSEFILPNAANIFVNASLTDFAS
jgi:hypothetical protein